MDPKFLKLIQSQGWVIESVGESDCVVRCPSSGCGMRTRIKEGPIVPRRDTSPGMEHDIPVESFDQFRRAMRRRREDLLMSITEVEEAAGMAQDQLAKCERSDYTKVPTFDFMAFWCESLGYKLYLRCVDLPPKTLRTISDTRHLTDARTQRVLLSRRRNRRKVS